jgi:hypothetical protein
MSFFTEAAAIIFKTPFRQKIGKIEIDILDNRAISERSTLASNPIEDGSLITDNIRRENTEISFNARMSSFSLNNSLISQISSLASGKIPNRLKEAHDELYRLYNSQNPIILVSKYKSYKNMIMTALDFASDPGDGEVLRFAVSFKEIQIAESQLVTVANSKIKVDNAKKQSNFGRQVAGTTTPAPLENPGNITFGQFVTSLF